MRQIERKGYDRDEAIKIVLRAFDQYELCPGGRSVPSLLDMIIPAV